MMRNMRIGGWALALLGLLHVPCASAAESPASCSSDGVPAPAVLVERFINADCADCWRRGATTDARPAADALTLDWIAFGASEQAGALAAAARLDATWRLRSLGRAVPKRQSSRRQTVRPPTVRGAALRVAHGLPFGNYIGASIEWSNAPPGAWRGWLALVEELPAGTAGSPIARRLVRNSLRLDWRVVAGGAAAPLRELRAMQIPEGADPARLALVGWVEAASGADRAPARLVALARSHCAPR